MQDADNYFDSVGLFQNQMIYTPIDEQIKYNSNNNIPKFYQYNEYSIPSYYDQFTSIPYINTKLNNHEDSVLNDNSNLYNNEESTISNNPLSFDFPFIHPRDTKDFTPFLLNNVPVDWLRSEDNDIILSDLGNEISPPTYQVKMVVELQETLFNRLQWYHVVCKFLDEDVCNFSDIFYELKCLFPMIGLTCLLWKKFCFGSISKIRRWKKKNKF